MIVRHVLLGVVLASMPVLAQDERPLAITGARILTMTGAPIDNGTVLIRDGRIEAVGADLRVPPGARVVDAHGGTLMPGLVSAWSSAGVTRPQGAQPAAQPGRRRGGGGGRGRRFGGGGSEGSSNNSAAAKVIDGIYPREKVFGELLQCGVTTLAVAPQGDGLPGLGAILDPAGTDRESLALREAAFVLVRPGQDTKAKETLRDSFAAAQRALEARKRAAARPPVTEKPTEEKPVEKPEVKAKTDAEPNKDGDAPAEKTAPTSPATDGTRGERDAEPNDPNVDVLADLLEGKQRAFLTLRSARQVVHYLDAVATVRFPHTVLVAADYAADEGLLELVAEQIKALTPEGVVLGTSLVTPAYSDELRNPAAELHAAAVPIAFVIGDSKSEVRGLFFRLIELVRHGLPADVALRGVTATPAKLLGLDDVGTIANGQIADLLLFSHDPLDPVSRLEKVWHRGHEVEAR